MPFWQRGLITLVAIIVASWVVTTLLEQLFGFRLPGYLAGVVGGIVAVPVWEFLQRVKPQA